MRKFILAFTLSLLFISFCALIFNAYVLQKDYFATTNDMANIENKDNVNVPITYTSFYSNYSKEIYDKAILENKVTMLFFTSNWCEKCVIQDSINKEVFADTSVKDVIGVNIHILDSETTAETNALSKKFDVSKENSYVFLNKKGAVSQKYVGEITKDKIIELITKAGDMK